MRIKIIVNVITVFNMKTICLKALNLLQSNLNKQKTDFLKFMMRMKTICTLKNSFLRFKTNRMKKTVLNVVLDGANSHKNYFKNMEKK